MAPVTAAARGMSTTQAPALRKKRAEAARITAARAPARRPHCRPANQPVAATKPMPIKKAGMRADQGDTPKVLYDRAVSQN